MCLAIPGRVVQFTDEASRLATVEIAGVRRTVNVSLLDQEHQCGVAIGDWVLVHVGFAISRVDEDEAHATLRLLEEMGSSYEEDLEELKAGSIE